MAAIAQAAAASVCYSVPRNKELMRIFRDLDRVEYLGSGMPRILKAYSEKAFRFTENFTRMSFPSAEKTSGKILELIGGHADITIPELAEAIGVTERSIERNIQILKENNCLRRIGSHHGGRWKLTQP
jgi:ATP-dependent DNA helicase RecG